MGGGTDAPLHLQIRQCVPPSLISCPNVQTTYISLYILLLVFLDLDLLPERVCHDILKTVHHRPSCFSPLGTASFPRFPTIVNRYIW